MEHGQEGLSGFLTVLKTIPEKCTHPVFQKELSCLPIIVEATEIVWLHILSQKDCILVLCLWPAKTWGCTQPVKSSESHPTLFLTIAPIAQTPEDHPSDCPCRPHEHQHNLFGNQMGSALPFLTSRKAGWIQPTEFPLEFYYMYSVNAFSKKPALRFLQPNLTCTLVQGLLASHPG